MRKMSGLVLLCLLCLLTACGLDGQGDGSDQAQSRVTAETAGMETGYTDTETDEDPHTLIVYFSQSGNTEQIAEYIRQDTGADIFRITTVEPYPDVLEDLYERGQTELDAGARPELAGIIENMDSYDTVFLGYPIWGGTCPMAVFSFMEQHDFTGKTVIPFCTHGGSGFSRSISDIEKTLPADITMKKGFSVSGSRAAEAQADVEAWLDTLQPGL